ncbi:hypothetical protein KQI63_11445 [bacterium]|nr:hypothetical protein [bacterium]
MDHQYLKDFIEKEIVRVKHEFRQTLSEEQKRGLDNGDLTVTCTIKESAEQDRPDHIKYDVDLEVIPNPKKN